MTKVWANGDDRRACRLPGVVVGLVDHLALRLQAEAQAVLLAERDEQGDVHVVDLVPVDHVAPLAAPGSQTSLHLVQPVAVVDRVEDGGSPRSNAWFSSWRFSARVRTISRAPAPVISWFQSSTSCSTVIEGKVAGSTSWGTRPSTSAARAVTTPRSR